jgi:GcrA cell cycle regulator
MDWTTDVIDRLRALWAEGHSTAEIGRRMGVSKNAVVGKAHRLNLPPRPSPIRRDPGAPRRTPAPRMAPAPRQFPGNGAARRPATAAAALAVPAVVRAQPTALPAPLGPAPAPAPPSAVVQSFPERAAPRNGGTRTCCWPLGEPGTPEFHFCCAEATPGKPYCAEHAAVAYVRARDRREDAA